MNVNTSSHSIHQDQGRLIREGFKILAILQWLRVKDCFRYVMGINGII